MELNASKNQVFDPVWLARIRRIIALEEIEDDARRNQMTPEQLSEEAILDRFYSDRGDV